MTLLESLNSEVLWLKQDNILVVILPLAMIWPPGQSIRFPRAFTWPMMQAKVKSRQIQGPSGLPSIEFLGSHEVFQILVVCPNFKLMLCAFQIMPPFLKSPDDC